LKQKISISQNTLFFNFRISFEHNYIYTYIHIIPLVSWFEEVNLGCSFGSSGDTGVLKTNIQFSASCPLFLRHASILSTLFGVCLLRKHNLIHRNNCIFLCLSIIAYYNKIDEKQMEHGTNQNSSSNPTNAVYIWNNKKKTKEKSITQTTKKTPPSKKSPPSH
jgi:hypothetical protein